MREIDEHVVLNSCIVVDEFEQSLREKGEILIPIEQGLLQPSAIHSDLGQLVAGHVAGRSSATRWTIFLSGGTGIEDVAVATRLVEAARARCAGTEFEFGLPYAFDP